MSKIENYVQKYRQKTGTSAHPNPEVTDAVIAGLTHNLETLGKPLCPCNFYPDKQKELQEHGRRWVCACDEMRL